MQNFINCLFIVAACMFMTVSAVAGICSLTTSNNREFGIGWFCGVVACLCAFAVYYCSATGIVPHG